MPIPSLNRRAHVVYDGGEPSAQVEGLQPDRRAATAGLSLDVLLLPAYSCSDDYLFVLRPPRYRCLFTTSLNNAGTDGCGSAGQMRVVLIPRNSLFCP